MSSAHRVSVNSRGPRTKPCEYWWQKERGEVLFLLTQERGFFFIVFCFANMGVVRMMKEMKLSCCKCHFEFFLPQWQMMKKYTHPFLLISFFTPSVTARPHKRDEALSSIRTSPKIHLVYPPNILYTHCLQFFLRWLWYPGDIKQKFCKIFGDKQGVLQEMCKWRMLFSKSGVLFTLLLNRTHSYC